MRLCISTLVLSCVVLCFASLLSAAESNAPAVTYSSTQVGEKTWHIVDNGTGSSNVYLIEGAKKALLIDTGMGNGKLYDYVQTLTKLPLTVVNTHGHPDHVGGNFQFNDVYANSNDFEMLPRFDHHEKRASGTKSIALHKIRDGQLIDLGDRKLEVIEVPGHTAGSIALLDSSHKLLFSGDNPNRLVWLFLKDSQSMEAYLKTLQKLNLRAGEYDTVLPGHGDPIDKSLIKEQITVAKNILEGSCTGKPYTHSSAPASTLVCEYKRASIAYDPAKLHAK
jgi:glyoxylase-like metal-dependent hydrolase (beta-lactamase superfamily II)